MAEFNLIAPTFLLDYRSVTLYQEWLNLGNEGTMADFIAWLRTPATEAAAQALQATAEALAAAQTLGQGIAAAEAAATLANTKAVLANDAALLANEKAALVDSAATLANTKAGLANDAAVLATEKAALADSKATLANEKAALAQSAADNANAKAAEVTSAVLSAGQLGPIKPTDAAPTPARNGNYTFSIGGNKPAWLTAEAGVTTVKAGDGVSVVFTEPSTYSYTHIKIDRIADIYNVTLEMPLTAGQYYTPTTARAAVPANIKKLGLKITYATSAGVWVEEQFIGSDVVSWNNVAYWSSNENVEFQVVNAKLVNSYFDSSARVFSYNGIHVHFIIPIQSGKIYMIDTLYTITSFLVKSDFTAATGVAIVNDGRYYTFNQDLNAQYANYQLLVININTQTNTVIDKFIKVKTIENDSTLIDKIESIKQTKYFEKTYDTLIPKLISEIYINGYTGDAYLTRIGLNVNGSYYFSITSVSTYNGTGIIAQFISQTLTTDEFGVITVVNGDVTLKFIANLAIAYTLCSIKLNHNSFVLEKNSLIATSKLAFLERITAVETKQNSELATLSFLLNQNLINSAVDACVNGYYYNTGIANVGGGGGVWTMSINPISVIGGLKLRITTTSYSTSAVAFVHVRDITGNIILSSIVVSNAIMPFDLTLPDNAAFLYYSFQKANLATTTIKVTEAKIGANPLALVRKPEISLYATKSEVGLSDKTYTIPFVPTKIYTVCNDLIPNSISAGYLQRNYNAKIFIERLFPFGTDSHNFKPTFVKGKLYKEIYAPISAYKGTFNSETTTGVGNSVAKTTKEITLAIENSNTSSLSITHRSTAASNGKSTQVRLLVIGDSITNKSGSDYGAVSGDATVFWSWIQRLFLMDKIDAGNNANEHNIITLGSQSAHDFEFTYNGIAKSVNSRAEGRSGWSTTDYVANEWRGGEVDNYAGYNYFYNADGTTCKFSLQKWIDHYRTMDDSGNRLIISSPTKGDRIVDNTTYNALSAHDKFIYRSIDSNWNVCTPTHIILQLGTNDTSNVTALANIQNMINVIRSEGFTNIFIGVAFVGAAGAVNIVEYENKYDKDTLLLSYANQDKAKLFTDSYKTLDNDSSKVNFIPTYFVQPTGDGLTMRNIDNLESLISGNSKFGAAFGNQANLHPNVNAHIAWAYQYYSWIKWTL